MIQLSSWLFLRAKVDVRLHAILWYCYINEQTNFETLVNEDVIYYLITGEQLVRYLLLLDSHHHSQHHILRLLLVYNYLTDKINFSNTFTWYQILHNFITRLFWRKMLLESWTILRIPRICRHLHLPLKNNEVKIVYVRAMWLYTRAAQKRVCQNPNKVFLVWQYCNSIDEFFIIYSMIIWNKIVTMVNPTTKDDKSNTVDSLRNTNSAHNNSSGW